MRTWRLRSLQGSGTAEQEINHDERIKIDEKMTIDGIICGRSLYKHNFDVRVITVCMCVNTD